MKAKRQILRMVILAFIGLVIGVSVYRWNARNLTGNQMPMPLGFGASVVLSGSMEPELSVDDLVIVKRTESVNVGDVVVFQSENQLIIHRVMEIQGQQLVTKGDANPSADDPIEMDAVKGVMVCVIPKAGAVVEIIQQPVVIVMVLLVAFGLTELSYRKEKQTDTDEMDAIKSEIRQLLDEIKEEQSNS